MKNEMKIFFATLVVAVFVSFISISAVKRNMEDELKEAGRREIEIRVAHDREKNKSLLAIVHEYRSQKNSETHASPAIWAEDSISRQEFCSCVWNCLPPDEMGESLPTREGYIEFFRPYAKEFWEISLQHGLDPRYIFALGIQETYWGSSDNCYFFNNLFGLGAYAQEGAIYYDSITSSIEDVCSLLQAYATPGTWYYNTILQYGGDPLTIEGQSLLYSSVPEKAKELEALMWEIFPKSSSV